MHGLRKLTSRMAAARRRLGLAQDRFIVLHTAGLAPRGGADTAILGLAMLRTRWGVSADLIVAHGDPRRAPACRPQLSRLRAVAADLGLTAQVRFAMPADHEQVRGYHHAANAVASTPWYAPGCRTTAIALACARPVVATRVRDIEHMIVDGLTGYLIAPRDAEALAGRLASLHRDPARAETMGAAGRQRLHAHLSQRHLGNAGMQARVAILDDERQPAWPPCGAVE